MTEKQKYVNQTQGHLDALEAEIQELLGKARTLSGEAETRREELVARLRDQANAVRKRIEPLKAAGEENWDDMVAEVEHVRKALIHSFNYFKSQL